MGLSFPDAIAILIALFIFILYLGANGAASRNRILNGSIALFFALFIGAAALFLTSRFAPDRLPAGFPTDMRQIDETYRLIMSLGWLVVAVLLTRALPQTVPLALRTLAGLILSFVLIIWGGNFLFTAVIGA